MFVKKLLKQVVKIIGWLNPLRWLRRGFFTFRNRWRRRAKVDYVTFILPDTMPVLPEERGFIRRQIFGDPPMSLLELDKHFRQVADDPRPKGVVLYLRGFAMSLASLQMLRASMLRLREKGKKVICFAQGYDLAMYYVASAADEIVLQPGGDFAPLGLREDAIFLKDALAAVGIRFDAVAISPYKGAFDQLTLDSISAEGREQLEWLLDSRYDIIVDDIAAARGMTPDAVREMIDHAPYLDTEVQGYVNAVLNEEALPEYLKSEHLVPWERAEKMLLRQWRKSSSEYVAMVRVQGPIVPGESKEPPVDLPIPLPFMVDERVGDLTFVRQVRHLMQDDDAAAVIIYIDSPGGSAAASEAMTAALDELAKTRPVIVYMHSVAASGGYYVATPAKWIVAQPGTITGSIGVISGKPITAGLFKNLLINRIEFQRGQNAGIYSDAAPFTDEQRLIMRRSIERVYEQFIGRVATSRGMTPEMVDQVGGGRVWTGVQAKEHRLVDELGDLHTALKKARELANLPDHAPLVLFEEDDEPLSPQVAEKANPAAGLNYLQEGIRAMFNGSAQLLMPFKIQ